MEQVLNLGMAKASGFLGVMLSCIYVLRVWNQKRFNNKNETIKTINKFLRKWHKVFGVIIVITGLVHGIYSEYSVLSFNFGTICWVFSILLGLNYMFRKRINKHKSWIVFHRILTIIFWVSLLIHIVLVKIN